MMRCELSKALLALLCMFLVSGSRAQGVDPTLPPSAEHAILTLHAIGSQIYGCQPVGSRDQYQWIFIAPAARLFDSGAGEVGTHGDGPTWNYQDSSSVQGVVKAKSASPDPASVPWLLLQATKPRGSGLLTRVEYIRRSETQGGVAPAAGCDPSHRGELARVPYTATYTFYSGK